MWENKKKNAQKKWRLFFVVVWTSNFNRGNKKGLQKLLTKETFKTFSSAIDSEKQPKQKQLLSLEINSIEKVWVQGKKIFIKIKFLSKYIDNEGKNEITKQDMWTFEKNINSQDPNWLLSSTIWKIESQKIISKN